MARLDDAASGLSQPLRRTSKTGAGEEGRTASVSSSRWSSAWVRRSALALVLVGVIMFPGHNAGVASRSCRGSVCPADGLVLWSRELTGSWIAETGISGTVSSQGQAFAAIGSSVGVVGSGLSVDAFDEGTGFPRWAATLSGLPAGADIVSVRAWPGVVTVGVTLPSGDAGSAGTGVAPRDEVVLDAVTGKRIAMFGAAEYGGAVSASIDRTVIVGTTSVTSYRNATGRAIWRDPIGSAGQGWQVDGDELYVTISAGGVIGTAPVTAVRQISLRTGAERLIQPPSGPFAGSLSAAADGVLLFSGTGGLTAYSESTGRLLWPQPRAGAVPEGIDPVQNVLYVDVAGALVGVDLATGRDERGGSVPGPPGTYGVRGGVALGLDPGPAGAAWGYSITKKHVIWTTRSLPWPHYFIDLSGIGGSADPASDTVLLATCAKVGSVVPGGAGLACLRPMLVAIKR